MSIHYREILTPSYCFKTCYILHDFSNHVLCMFLISLHRQWSNSIVSTYFLIQFVSTISLWNGKFWQQIYPQTCQRIVRNLALKKEYTNFNQNIDICCGGGVCMIIFKGGGGVLTLHAGCCSRLEKADEWGGGGSTPGLKKLMNTPTLFPLPKHWDGG